MTDPNPMLSPQDEYHHGETEGENTQIDSQARYQALFNETLDAILLSNDEGIYIDANPAASDLLGYDHNELLGKTIMDLSEADEATFQEMWRTFLEAGRMRGEYRLRTKQGDLLDVEFNAVANVAPGWHLSSLRNITKRKQAEEALRQNEEKYRTLFESIDEGFCIVEVLFDDDGQPTDYRFLETNPTFERQSGLPDAKGKRMRELEPRHEGYWFETYGRIAVTGVPERFVNEAKFLAGRSFDVYAFRIGRPEDRQVAVLFRDITERARAEEAVRQMNEVLEHRVAERTGQVRSLITQLTLSEQAERRRISQILHDDLQQRLYSVQFQLAALRTSLGDEPQERAWDLIDGIKTVLENAVQIMRSLSVDLSPPILYNEGLTGAVRWLANQMVGEHGLSVEVVATNDVPVPDDDLRVLLFQAVRELLFNVVKHANVPGAAISLSRVDHYIRIEVTDQGKGFDVEAVVANALRSHGLLQIRQRLELVGGDVQVESIPGAGTRVVITCPLLDTAS